MHYKVWDEIPSPFPNFNVSAFETWELVHEPVGLVGTILGE